MNCESTIRRFEQELSTALHHHPPTDLVILPGVSVSVDLDHVLVSRAEAGAEDGVGDVPVHVYGLETGDCGHEGEEGQPGLLTHLHISRSLLSGWRDSEVRPCHRVTAPHVLPR